MTMLEDYERKHDQNAEDFIRKMVEDGWSEEHALRAWEGNQSPIGGYCFYCGKFTPHDKGLNLRYIGGHGDVYVCEECSV